MFSVTLNIIEHQKNNVWYGPTHNPEYLEEYHMHNDTFIYKHTSTLGGGAQSTCYQKFILK